MPRLPYIVAFLILFTWFLGWKTPNQQVIPQQQNQNASLLKVSFPNDLQVFVSTSNRDYTNWWQKQFPKWERETFRLFHSYLSTGTYKTYIGFGEWIGPTILYASHFVNRAFALEPDPTCRKVLKENVAANSEIARKVHVSSFCVSSHTKNMTMHGAGGSGSFLGSVQSNTSVEYTQQYPTSNFMVHCIPLDAFVVEHDISLVNAFVKVDCEGAEWDVVPSLFKLISSLSAGQRPTIFISVHPNDARSQAMEGFVAVVRLFRFAAIYEPQAKLPISTPSSALTSEKINERCPTWCDIILSDFTE